MGVPFDASTGAIGDHGTPVTPEQILVAWSDPGARWPQDRVRDETRRQPRGRALARQCRWHSARTTGAKRVRGGLGPRLAHFCLPAVSRGVRRVGAGDARGRRAGTPVVTLEPRVGVPAERLDGDGAMLLGSYLVSNLGAGGVWPSGPPKSSRRNQWRIALDVTNASLGKRGFLQTCGGSPVSCKRTAARKVSNSGSYPRMAGTSESVRIAKITRGRINRSGPPMAGRSTFSLVSTLPMYLISGVSPSISTRALGTPFRVTRFDSPSQMISPDLGNTDIGISQRAALLTIETVTGNVWVSTTQTNEVI